MTASTRSSSAFNFQLSTVDFLFRQPGDALRETGTEVTVADPAKRGGAFTGSQGLYLQTLNEIVAILPILPAPRNAPPTGVLAGY